MTRPTNEMGSADHETLVSYLDGELDATEAAAVEQRLAQDEPFRQLLNRLRETWDLLDSLPHPTLDDGFTQTTVEMVAVNVADQSERTETTKLSERFRRPFTLTLAALACGISSFGVMRFVQQRSDAQILNSLPILLQLDEYRQTSGIQLLEDLVEANLFSAEPVAVASESHNAENVTTVAGASSGADGFAPVLEQGNAGNELNRHTAGQALLADMTLAEKRRLLENHERFQNLQSAEQQRIRSLHEQLASHPNHVQLTDVMQAYTRWLAELDPKERAMLKELEDQPAKHLESIGTLHRRHGSQQLAALGLTQLDVKTIHQWFTESAAKKRLQLWKLMRPDDEAIPEPMLQPRNQFFFFALILRNVANRNSIIELLPVEKLIAQLSPSAKSRYQAKQTVDEQYELIQQWLHASFRSRMGPPAKTAEELLRMRRDMPQHEQEKLEKLPPDHVIAEVRKWYEMRWLSRQHRGGMGDFRGRRRAGERGTGPGRMRRRGRADRPYESRQEKADHNAPNPTESPSE